jgi:hypothetical protein
MVLSMAVPPADGIQTRWLSTVLLIGRAAHTLRSTAAATSVPPVGALPSTVCWPAALIALGRCQAAHTRCSPPASTSAPLDEAARDTPCWALVPHQRVER